MINIISLLREWQERLRMMDWDLYLKTDCTTDDIDKNMADCRHQSVFKLAKIRICSKDEFKQALVPNLDEGLVDKIMEQTLVHELLHAKFSIVHDDIEDKRSKNSAIYGVLHQNIEDLAMALVARKYDIDESLVKYGWRFEEEYERA